MGLKIEQWLQSYNEATKEEHSFLFINFQQPRSMRMWENFEKVLFHREPEEEVDPVEERKRLKRERESKQVVSPK